MSIPDILKETMKKNILSTDTILDIGCGNKEKHCILKENKITTVDAWEKVKPDFLVDLNVVRLPFQSNSFDVLLMIDFIEHLEKSKGEIVIADAKNITRKKIILFTPLWWTDNATNVNNPELWCYGNQYDYHRSLWTLEDFASWERIRCNNEDLGISYFLGIWNKS